MKNKEPNKILDGNMNLTKIDDITRDDVVIVL